MSSVLIEIINKLPPWSYHVFAVIICLALLLYFGRVFGKDDKLNKLIDSALTSKEEVKQYEQQIYGFENQIRILQNENSQITSCMNSIRNLIDQLNNIKTLSDPSTILRETDELFQRTIETLAYDIKALSGEKHRCGIWLYSFERDLVLAVASSGFPKDYIGNRRLELDRSIAGRCFRKKESINCPDITNDEDWSENPNSNSPYKSLICIPLGEWGVLTIDALTPLNRTCMLIGELYASIIESTMLEYYKATSLIPDVVPDSNANVG